MTLLVSKVYDICNKNQNFSADEIFKTQNPRKDGLELFLTCSWKIMLCMSVTFPFHFYVFIERGGSVGDVWDFKNPYLKFISILGFSAIMSNQSIVVY